MWAFRGQLPGQTAERASTCLFPFQLYELDSDPKRKEFLDDLFTFMQKRGEPHPPSVVRPGSVPLVVLAAEDHLQVGGNAAVLPRWSLETVDLHGLPGALRPVERPPL